MAVNLYPDGPISPRISFSHDLDHHPSSDHVPRSDQDLLLLQHPSPNNPSDNDFDFDFGLGFPASELGHETSPADELFSNGVIIPTHMRQTQPDPPNGGFPPLQEAKETGEEGGEIITASTKASLIREEKGSSRSFWRFMRSSSLNSEGSHCKKASIWPSLPLLARSNSTGSSPTKLTHGKSGGSYGYNYRQLPKPASSCSSSGFHQKPPLKKVYGGQPLNVPPPYITKGTSDLLGFGSLFRNSNDKKR